VSVGDRVLQAEGPEYSIIAGGELNLTERGRPLGGTPAPFRYRKTRAGAMRCDKKQEPRRPGPSSRESRRSVSSDFLVFIIYYHLIIITQKLQTPSIAIIPKQPLSIRLILHAIP